MDEDREYLLDIPGRVPDPRLPPPGCLFAPRCAFALNRCWQEHPPLVEASARHLLRCYNPQPYAAVERLTHARVAGPTE